MSMSRSIISEDLEGFFSIIEVLRSPGLVGLMDANKQDLPCSGLITFNIQIAGRRWDDGRPRRRGMPTSLFSHPRNFTTPHTPSRKELTTGV